MDLVSVVHSVSPQPLSHSPQQSLSTGPFTKDEESAGEDGGDEGDDGLDLVSVWSSVSPRDDPTNIRVHWKSSVNRGSKDGCV